MYQAWGGERLHGSPSSPSVIQQIAAEECTSSAAILAQGRSLWPILFPHPPCPVSPWDLGEGLGFSRAPCPPLRTGAGLSEGTLLTVSRQRRESPHQSGRLPWVYPLWGGPSADSSA